MSSVTQGAVPTAVPGPVRERRAKYEADPDLVRDIVATGNARARAEAEQTMAAVREAMHFTGPMMDLKAVR